MHLVHRIFVSLKVLLVSMLSVSVAISKANAQTFNFHTSEASAIATGDRLYYHGFADTLTVWCNDWDYIIGNITTWGDDFKLKSNHSFLKFYVDHSNLITKYLTPVSYSYLLAYKLRGYPDPTDTVSTFLDDVDTLTINFNNDEINNPYQDLNLKKYSNYYKIRVELFGIFRDSSGILVPAILSDTTVRTFAVEASILTQRFDKKEYGMGPGTTAPVITVTPHLSENYLDLAWTFPSGSVTPINYELEWTYVDDYGVTLPGGYESPRSLSDLQFDFRFNNTRVWLSDNNYKIPIVYPRGYIVYRVRSVRPDSTLFKFPIYGTWSIPSSTGDFGPFTSLSASDYYHINTPYTGDSLNWQYTASFAEGGRYKNVATFYDGLLKNRQSITRLNSNLDKLIATGNIYDHEGRLSIKSLPTPVQVPSFTYQYNLLLNSATTTPYRASDFDTGSLHFSLIPPLASNALANIYYSIHNPDSSLRHQKFVADAQGYPMVQTIFESGAQSRVLAQGGAGVALQIGNPNYISNAYVSADQTLINSLFGPNIGWGAFYTASYSSDPNGQYSMTINDYHGKPMVSALIGNAPSSSAYAINQVDVPDSNSVKQNLLNSPASQYTDILTGKKNADLDYFSEAHSTDSLQYACNFIPYEACSGQYLAVKGHYNITVTDQYGNAVLTEDNLIGNNGVSASGTPLAYLGPVGHFPAHIGTYHVKKSIKFLPSDIEAVVDSFFKVANCFTSLPHFIRESVSETEFPCIGDLDGPAYDSDDCAGNEWQMMQQLFPNAAYGKYTINDGYMTSTPNSIYTIFCNCYHAFALYGEDTSLVISRQGARGIVNHRAPFTQVTIPDTCVADTFFTHNITIKAFSYFDSIDVLYMPFMGENGVTGDTAMTGYYRIRSNWNLGRINGAIYSAGTVIGSVVQHAGYNSSVPDTTIFVLPVGVSGTHFFTDLHANALSATGDSLWFEFEGIQTNPYAHSPSWESPYVDWHDPGCLARYQDTCLLPNFPDTITVNGTHYSGLRTMDHVAFNNLYFEAVAAGNYSIARALLPLHPQYCQLTNCFTDNFRKQLIAIPDWQTAETLNRLYLDSIIAHDPLKAKMSATGLFADPADSLRKFRGTDIRLDSFILMNAYCASRDAVMTANCITDMFDYEISQHLLISDDIKRYYFAAIVDLYLSNRQRFVDSVRLHNSNSCGPCAEKRMKLDSNFAIFPPPIPIDSPLVLAGGENVNWLSAIFTDSVAQLQDSVLAWHQEKDAELSEIAIDSIMARLKPCVDPAGATGSSIRSQLAALVSSGQVTTGNFTREQIFDIIRAHSITLDDFCNPFAVCFPSLHTAPIQEDCNTPAFYNNIASFLDRPQVINALHAYGSVLEYVTLDTTLNHVERDISRRLGNIQHVGVWAQYNSTLQLYTLSVHDTSIGATVDSVNIMLHSYACAEVFSITATYTTTVTCHKAHPSFGVFKSGFIHKFSFVAEINDGSTNCRVIGWIDSVRTMSRAQGGVGSCIPCTQLRGLYNAFRDSLQIYGIKGADHPLHGIMLKNFMNTALFERYSASDYEMFMRSCALADSIEIPLYNYYATFKFGGAGADLLISSLNSVDPEYNFDDSYRDSVDISGTPEITIGIDLKKVPENKLKDYLAVLQFFTSSLPPGSSHINVPLKDVHGSGEIGYIYEDPAYPFDPSTASLVNPSTISFNGPYDKAVWMGGKFEMRKFYDVRKLSGATPADISRAIYNITAHIYNNNLQGVVFVPAYHSTIDEAYFKPEKQAYLSYVYDFQHLPDYEVLNNLRTSSLLANIPSYAPYYATYSRHSAPGIFSDLFLWNAGMNTRLYDTLQRIIDLASSTGEIFYPSASVAVSAAPAQLNVYRCSDWSYWYRYFSTADTLFNVYLRFPEYIPASIRSSYAVAGPVIPLPADSINRHFALRVSIPGSGDTLLLHGLASFVIGNAIQLSNVLMRHTPIYNNNGADTFNNCERQTLYSAINTGIYNYNAYIDSIRGTITANFRESALTSLQEALYLRYTTNKKFFTLYNYDRAGNLTSTIPPAGNIPIPQGAGLNAIDNHRANNTPASAATPTILKQNTYQYTSLNALRRQTTINGGETRFFYDAIGRLLFSQNAKQAPEGYFTYNIYDPLGRISETGEVQLACPYFVPYHATAPNGHVGCNYESLVGEEDYLVTPYPSLVDSSEYKPYDTIVALIRSRPRRDVVHTTYDTIVNLLDTVPGMSAQQHLRKRISTVRYYRTLDTSIYAYGNYNYATHYSYDPQGNVATLTHDYPYLATYRRRYTRVDYDYDVISGKVNMLSYNRGFADQFYQKYDYDADNRITEVHTSSDGYIWKNDARYTYYQHGPLARLELGDLRVQGLDYAYTIQGWLKALNGDTLNTYMEIGEDGRPGQIHARDAVAHTINYFANDYSTITGRTIQNTPTLTRSLYNGNIAGQTMAIDTFQRLYKNYVYDQLNRIHTAQYATVDISTGTLTSISDYHSHYAYDPDGNITSLVRYGNNISGAVSVMDTLEYKYSSPTHDQFHDIHDLAPNTYTNDFKFHNNPQSTRYQYDPIGNLIVNLESGQDTIRWNLYNKVTEVVNSTDTSKLRYDYDPMGNRVAKHYIKKTITPNDEIIKSEYYIRDAQGNILATYKGIDRHGNIANFRELGLSAHDIYGSSRLGQKNHFGLEIGESVEFGLLEEGLHDTTRFRARMPWYSLEYQDVIHKDSTTPYGSTWLERNYAKHTIGYKQYEITDHLGNVLATLSDKRSGAEFLGTLSPGSDVMIDAWKPIVTAEYDYYPFGQYMPGRYTVDTATHCLSTTYSGMGTVHVPRQADLTHIADYMGGSAAWIPAGGGVSINSSSIGTGGEITISPISVYGNNVKVQFNLTADFSLYVIDDATGAVIGSTGVTTGSMSPVTINILSTPHSSTVRLRAITATTVTGTINITSIVTPQDTTVPVNILANVCNGGGYRYGYNGQMKDNEWAGVGNHYEFKFRNYDPRTGRFFSVDPLDKQYPWNSGYAFAENRVIDGIDLEGLERYYTADGKLLGKYGTSTELRVVYQSSIPLANALFTGATTTGTLSDANDYLLRFGSAPVNNDPNTLAHQWGEAINGTSIVSHAEFSSTIYRVNIDGKVYFTYSKPTPGSSSDNIAEQVPNAWAGIHSHGAFTQNSDRFSTGNDPGTNGTGDIETIRAARYPMAYLTTGSGSLWQYNSTTGVPTRIASDLESDPKASRTNRLNNKNPTADKRYFDGYPKDFDNNKAIRRIDKYNKPEKTN